MKRSFVYLTLFAMLIAVLMGLYFIKSSYEILPLDTIKAGHPKAVSEWFKYEDKIHGFNVSLPLLPQVATQDLTDPKTGEVRHYEMYVAQMDGTIYMISLITFPKELDDSLKSLTMKSIMSDMVTVNKSNKLLKSTEISYEDMPAIDFTIDNEKTTIEAREFFRGQTLYLLSTIVPKNAVEKSHFKHFIDSLKLVEPAK